MIYRYVFHTEWLDDKGRLWAHRHESESAADARRAHTAALGWDWVKCNLKPSVSDLYSISHNVDANGKTQPEMGRTTIQLGGSRQHHEATLPVERQARARDEVIRRVTPEPHEERDNSFHVPF